MPFDLPQKQSLDLQDTLPTKPRCFGNTPYQPDYALYHDRYWCKQKFDDESLFEYLTLEGAQAGLRWITIWRKRQGYRAAFYNFSVKKIMTMCDEELNFILRNSQIVRNRLKVFSVRKNAAAFIKIQNEFGSFSKYIWGFTHNRQLVNTWQNVQEIPARTFLSDTISQDLKRRGMSFVGTTIIYSYMQAIGMGQ